MLSSGYGINNDLQARESKNLLLLEPVWMSGLRTTECDPLLLEVMMSFIRSLSKYLLSPCSVRQCFGLGGPSGKRGKAPVLWSTHWSGQHYVYTRVSRYPGLWSQQTSREDMEASVFYPERSGVLRTSPLYCVQGVCGGGTAMGF